MHKLGIASVRSVTIDAYFYGSMVQAITFAGNLSECCLAIGGCHRVRSPDLSATALVVNLIL